MAIIKSGRSLFRPFTALINTIQGVTSFLVNLIKVIFGPYVVLRKEKFSFMLWVAAVIIIGQFGIILSLLVNYNIGLEKNIFINLSTGNFYVFSISILGIAIYDGFVQYLNSNETTLFKRYQIGSWVIAFIMVIFMSALYAIIVYKSNQYQYTFTRTDGHIQIVFYILSIALSIYIFSVKHLDTHKYDFYHLADDRHVKELKLSANNIDDTIEGGIEI